MFPKIVYWSSTAIVAVALLGALTYLTGSEQVVSGFARSGYPQHLRIVLGFAKPAAAIVLLAPGLPLLKEWAYAGATFAWVMATIAAYSIGDGVQAMGHAAGPPGTAGRVLCNQAFEPSVTKAQWILSHPSVSASARLGPWSGCCTSALFQGRRRRVIQSTG